MMNDKFLAALAGRASKVITLKNLFFECRAKIKAMWFSRSPSIPAWIILTLKFFGEGFSQINPFRGSHKNIFPSLRIPSHTFPRAVLPISGSYEYLATSNTCLFNNRSMSVFIHRVFQTTKSLLTSLPIRNPLFSFKRTMARMGFPVFKMAFITAKFTYTPLIRATTIKAESLKALRFYPTFNRAIFTLRFLRDVYHKGFATLKASFSYFPTFPMRIKDSSSSFTPSLITFRATKMMVAPRLPKRSLEFLTAGIAIKVCHMSNYNISCEVRQWRLAIS